MAAHYVQTRGHTDMKDLISAYLSTIIMNNLSEIHRIVQNPKKHSFCLKTLLQMIMFIRQHSHMSAIDEKVLEGIFRNASRMVLVDPVAAAA